MKHSTIRRSSPHSSSASRRSWISNVIASPLMKLFSRMTVNSANCYDNSNQKEQWNSEYSRHKEEDEAFWRLSFREKIVDNGCETGFDSSESSRRSSIKPGGGSAEKTKVQREDHHLMRLETTDLSDYEEETNWEHKSSKEMNERRKTMYVRRKVVEKKRSKQRAIRVKAVSPRSGTKQRSKKNEGKISEFSPGMDGVAVVKISTNPQKDFRNSMLEMINGRDLSHLEELEELLVCYLQLNCDEYHELIIKVFRQLWFELNQSCPFCHLEKQKLFISETK